MRPSISLYKVADATRPCVTCREFPRRSERTLRAQDDFCARAPRDVRLGT